MACAASREFFPAAHALTETEADLAALIAGGLARLEGPASPSCRPARELFGRSASASRP